MEGESRSQGELHERGAQLPEGLGEVGHGPAAVIDGDEAGGEQLGQPLAHRREREPAVEAVSGGASLSTVMPSGGGSARQPLPSATTSAMTRAMTSPRWADRSGGSMEGAL
ncbi:hypothetical protein BON30_27945 [Cystobacter ferrugineus]|uniref:Uncharacterized protein n=1 Tax=Cystobacter ferrugineus TaxID=83449 RepID=A0A1L9B4M3_9BACT|nr:hypothetical protein BON30_27945 [Cystobacter ferrugineus]